MKYLLLLGFALSSSVYAENKSQLAQLCFVSGAEVDTVLEKDPASEKSFVSKTNKDIKLKNGLTFSFSSEASVWNYVDTAGNNHFLVNQSLTLKDKNSSTSISLHQAPIFASEAELKDVQHGVFLPSEGMEYSYFCTMFQCPEISGVITTESGKRIEIECQIRGMRF